MIIVKSSMLKTYPDVTRGPGVLGQLIYDILGSDGQLSCQIQLKYHENQLKVGD